MFMQSAMNRRSNYEKFPCVSAPGDEQAVAVGWVQISERLKRAIAKRGGVNTTLVIECYTGVDEAEVLRQLTTLLAPTLVLHARDAMLPPDRIDRLVEPFVGGDDPVFGWLSGLELPQFFDPEKVAQLRYRAESVPAGLVLVLGCGARLVADGDLLVYADLARREAELRFRRNEASNLGVENRTLEAGLQYKRGFFVDWRVCDRWKRPLVAQWDFVLDTHDPREPKLVEGESVRRALHVAARRPFRVVPYFDPAPWGGHWMKEVCDLDRSASNYGWCFDCVPEENSLLLGFGRHRFELPSLDLVFHQPRALLGEAVHARFGDEFPIRFDFLDTMAGGNLSFQVHPLTEYIQHHFGMHYTQDESYYLLDAASDGCVYLGLREGIQPEAMIRELEAAQAGGPPFEINRYVNRWPARKHDHFLIPAGTVHCSGRNSMVLEISATPYIFTFKLWDWGRPGLDGRPRPIHLNHGVPNIQWDRTTSWVRDNLINRIAPIAQGAGWREERTGLHEREFIETRRHWFTGAAPHDGGKGVSVLNLVEGEEVLVKSPDRAFEPFTVHYAETFIVPAAAGPFTVRPHGDSSGKECATIKANVRV